MNRISNQVLSPQELKCIDLYPLMSQYFNTEAQNIIQNHKTSSTLVQWNKQVGNSKYEGEHVQRLGTFLNKIQINTWEDLFVSNYVREVSQVKYYGHTVERHKVAEAALSLINFFNDLASKGLIRAVLTPLMSLELVGGKIVIVSYLAVDQPNEALVQSMYGALEFREGGLPPEFK